MMENESWRNSCEQLKEELCQYAEQYLDSRRLAQSLSAPAQPPQCPPFESDALVKRCAQMDDNLIRFMGRVLQLCREAGKPLAEVEVMCNLPEYYAIHSPDASVHNDLWSCDPFWGSEGVAQEVPSKFVWPCSPSSDVADREPEGSIPSSVEVVGVPLAAPEIDAVSSNADTTGAELQRRCASAECDVAQPGNKDFVFQEEHHRQVEKVSELSSDLATFATTAIIPPPLDTEGCDVVFSTDVQPGEGKNSAHVSVTNDGVADLVAAPLCCTSTAGAASTGDILPIVNTAGVELHAWCASLEHKVMQLTNEGSLLRAERAQQAAEVLELRSQVARIAALAVDASAGGYESMDHRRAKGGCIAVSRDVALMKGSSPTDDASLAVLLDAGVRLDGSVPSTTVPESAPESPAMSMSSTIPCTQPDDTLGPWVCPSTVPSTAGVRLDGSVPSSMAPQSAPESTSMSTSTIPFTEPDDALGPMVYPSTTRSVVGVRLDGSGPSSRIPRGVIVWNHRDVMRNVGIHSPAIDC